ncbi:MAG: 23S rRNA (adenine(2503)-C(2))-methyltransferase RlmN, partial [Bacteroidota bacterium]
MTNVATLTDIRSLSLEDLTAELILLGERPFRAKQVYEWLWVKGARSFDAMTNLSLTLRETLKTKFSLLVLQEDKVQRSSDGTIKSRFRLHDGHLIESVLIPVVADDRFTV